MQLTGLGLSGHPAQDTTGIDDRNEGVRSVAIKDDHGHGGGCISHDGAGFHPRPSTNAQLLTPARCGVDKIGITIHHGVGLNAVNKLIRSRIDHLVVGDVLQATGKGFTYLFLVVINPVITVYIYRLLTDC